MRKLLIVELICFILIAGCASTPREKFESIHVGMYKGDVLDTMGAPSHSEFKNDEHIWTYRFYDGDTKVEKEIRMKNDSVNYVGEVQKPKGNPFDRVKVGMEKADVLDIIGFPKSVEKRKTSEVWTYLDGKTKRTLVMTSGKVSSLGAPPKEASSNADGFVPVEE